MLVTLKAQFSTHVSMLNSRLLAARNVLFPGWVPGHSTRILLPGYQMTNVVHPSTRMLYSLRRRDRLFGQDRSHVWVGPGVELRDGAVLFATGQGIGRTQLVRLDPSWLLLPLTKAADFTTALARHDCAPAHAHMRTRTRARACAHAHAHAHAGGTGRVARAHPFCRRPRRRGTSRRSSDRPTTSPAGQNLVASKTGQAHSALCVPRSAKFHTPF